MEYFGIAYATICVATYLDLLSTTIVLRQTKNSVPMKQRGELINSIEYLDSLKIYCIAWPYVIYKMIQENAK